MPGLSRFACAVLAVFAWCQPAPAQELPRLHVPPGRIFVAGISSGGYMAVQMHVAFSGLFKGAAVYAGGPDDCARDSVLVAVTTCLGNVPPVDVNALTATVRTWAASHGIDPLENLRGQPVYLWSGLLDTTVVQPLMNALDTQYKALGADVFRYDNGFYAQHGWESPYGPLPCGTAASPYVIECFRGYQQQNGPGSSDPGYGRPYDSEAVWLSRFFGRLAPKNEGALRGKVVAFDQNRFAPGGSAPAISMDNTGYAFVPESCAAGRACGLVLALHGCVQSYSAVGMAFVNDAGLNQWADTNDLVVLYPQAIATAGVNPQGCWNWWGYLGDPDYAQKTGPQMRALRGMVGRVAEERGQDRDHDYDR